MIFIQFYLRFYFLLLQIVISGGVFCLLYSVFTIKTLPNKTKLQLFVSYLKVTVGIPMTTNKKVKEQQKEARY